MTSDQGSSAPSPIWDRRTVPALAKPGLRLFERDVLSAYQDGGGVWTEGTGSTIDPQGHPVQRGDRVTQVQDDAMLTHELTMIRMPALLKAVPASVAITEATAAMLLSFVYNEGIGALAVGNVITEMLQSGLIERALMGQLPGWCIATQDGLRGPSLGILHRRRCEGLIAMGAPLHPTYEQVWKLGLTELMPLYEDACKDAAAFRSGVVTWEVHTTPLPVSKPAPKPAIAHTLHAGGAPKANPQQPGADALDDQFNPPESV